MESSAFVVVNMVESCWCPSCGYILCEKHNFEGAHRFCGAEKLREREREKERDERARWLRAEALADEERMRLFVGEMGFSGGEVLRSRCESGWKFFTSGWNLRLGGICVYSQITCVVYKWHGMRCSSECLRVRHHHQKLLLRHRHQKTPPSPKKRFFAIPNPREAAAAESGVRKERRKIMAQKAKSVEDTLQGVARDQVGC